MQEDRQVSEVQDTSTQVGNTNVRHQSIERKTAVSGIVVAQRIIYYVGGAIIALLFVRLLLQLFGANQSSEFVNFIYSLSGIFVTPFTGIFGEPTFGQSHFETSTLVAIVIYALLTVGLAKLFTITRPRDEI